MPSILTIKIGISKVTIERIRALGRAGLSIAELGKLLYSVQVSNSIILMFAQNGELQ